MMGTILTVLHFQIRVISRFRSWYFSIFSFSLMFTLVLKGKATSKIRHVLSSFFNTTISDLLCSRGWSVWILKSNNNFIMSDSSTACGSCYTIFPRFQSCTSRRTASGLFVPPYRVSKAGIGSEQTSYIPPNMADWFLSPLIHPARSRYSLLVDPILYTVCP